MPEDADFIGFPAFKFIFDFAPKRKMDTIHNEEDIHSNKQKKETMNGSKSKEEEEEEGLDKVDVVCVGCYAYQKGSGKFVMLSSGLENDFEEDEEGEEGREDDEGPKEEYDAMFYKPKAENS